MLSHSLTGTSDLLATVLSRGLVGRYLRALAPTRIVVSGVSSGLLSDSQTGPAAMRSKGSSEPLQQQRRRKGLRPCRRNAPVAIEQRKMQPGRRSAPTIRMVGG